MGIFDKGVKKTNRGFFDRLSRAIIGKTQVDEDLLDAIEEALLYQQCLLYHSKDGIISLRRNP